MKFTYLIYLAVLGAPALVAAAPAADTEVTITIHQDGFASGRYNTVAHQYNGCTRDSDCGINPSYVCRQGRCVLEP
ncbi:hypothetical protein FB451DRAFT_1397561 [Mycena latifolia]|nr:hypothetical protein FB451DRAFT_1397561 [Mycena latifolia]